MCYRFSALFLEALPLEHSQRVWDIFLFEGTLAQCSVSTSITDLIYLSRRAIPVSRGPRYYLPMQKPSHADVRARRRPAPLAPSPVQRIAQHRGRVPGAHHVGEAQGRRPAEAAYQAFRRTHEAAGANTDARLPDELDRLCRAVYISPAEMTAFKFPRSCVVD